MAKLNGGPRLSVFLFTAWGGAASELDLGELKTKGHYMKVIVVGTGIIGASIAWHLSRGGAEVSMVDSAAAAASSTSFGWINASFYADAHHHRLRVAGLEAYGRLQGAVPDAPINMCGALWWEDQDAGLQAMKAALEAFEYPVEQLDVTQSSEPDLKELPAQLLRFPAEGCVEVEDLARCLIADPGVRVMAGVNVMGIVVKDGVVSGVQTSTGLIEADRVVVAAGNGAPDILATCGVKLPMLTRPGVLVRTKPVAAKISQILVTPHGEARQLPDGRLLASGVANHQGDDASVVRETPEDIAARVIRWLDPMIAGETIEWERVAVAYRPVPQDGLPVIGAVGPRGLHVAVMHSGATLAAIVGEAVTAEVVGQGGFQDLLAPYRPQRFQ